MNVIFNDFSIDEQFCNIGTFVYSIYEETLPSMEYIAELDGFLLLKSKSIFEKNICKYFNFFLSSQAFGYAELSKFRKVLVQLVDDPF